MQACFGDKALKKLQEGYSLCRTCISYLKKSQMPPMCRKNSLEPAVVPDCLSKMSSLEKQLISKNLIFMKIRQLPKTRMMALNDRVINIPLTDENIAKTVTSLPRNDDNSGMINIGLKRRLNMKNYHQHGLINPDRVFKACKYLIEHHPDYKNIRLTSYEEWIKQCPTLFDQTENSDDEDDKNSSDEESAEASVGKPLIHEEAEKNYFNNITSLFPKEPVLDRGHR